MERPCYITDEHLEYLDELRESGVVNMFGSAPYLAEEYGLDKNESRKIVAYWMTSFDERHPEKERTVDEL